MIEVSQLSSIQKLMDKLNEEPIFLRYRELGIKVHQNQELLEMYNQYLKLQKEMVNLKHYKKRNVEKENEFKTIEESLFEIPLFNEYIQLQIEIENLFQTIAHLIQDGVNRELCE